jgi:hypothetical protein
MTAWCKKWREEHDARTIKRCTFVRPGPDMEIARERRPSALLTKSHNPFDIGDAFAEHIPQGNDMMLSIEQRMQRSGDPRREVIVEEQPQATSRFSKLTASRTAASCNSYNRATCSGEPSASIARRIVSVGAPPSLTMGGRSTSRRPTTSCGAPEHRKAGLSRVVINP